MKVERVASTPIRGSEGYAVARNTIFNLLGFGLPLLVGLVSIPIAARFLGESRFGLLGLVWAVLGSFALIDLGLGTATTKLVAEYLGKGMEDAASRLVHVSTTIHTALGTVVGIAFAALTPFLVSTALEVPAPLMVEAQTTFFILAATVPFMLFGSSLRAVLEAAQRFDLTNLIRAPSASAIFVIPAVGAAFGVGLPGIMLLLLIVRGTVCLAQARAVRIALPFFKWAAPTDCRSLRPLLSYSMWVAVSNTLNPVLIYLDRFLLGSIVSLTAVAYYTAPFEVATRLLIIPAGLASALFPAFTVLQARDEKGKLRHLLATSVRHLVLGVGVPLLLLMAFARDLLSVGLGPTYASESTLAMQILAGGVFMNSLAYVPHGCLRAIGRPDLPAKFHLLELPIYVFIAWFLVGRYGVAGAAMAWTFRVTLDMALLILGVSVVVGITPKRIFAGSGARAILAVAALGLVLFTIAVGISSPLVRLAFAGLATLTLAYYAWHKVLASRERAALSRLVRAAARRAQWM